MRKGKSMLLGLAKIIDNPGASVSFSTSVDLSDLCYGVSQPVTEPVVAEGMVRNTAGVMMATGEIATDVGTILYGKEAVSSGLIDRLGGLSDALAALHRMIGKNKK